MKKQLLIALGLAFTVGTTVFAQQDPVLMEVDGKKITKSEFLQIYLKNNNNPKYDKQTLDEYIELFKKFQLKVAEAEALGYDTIPKLKRELEGYQKQLAQPYLTDNEMTGGIGGFAAAVLGTPITSLNPPRTAGVEVKYQF